MESQNRDIFFEKKLNKQKKFASATKRGPHCLRGTNSKQKTRAVFN